MFRGLYAINLDEKGRITIPTHFRETILEIEPSSQVVLTIDPEDRCLSLYPCSYWYDIEKKLQALPSFHPMTRRIQRLLLGHAILLKIDEKTGRILLPVPLREYAGLDKALMLVGQGKKIEIWDEAHWQTSREHWLAQNMQNGGALPPELTSLCL